MCIRDRLSLVLIRIYYEEHFQIISSFHRRDSNDVRRYGTRCPDQEFFRNLQKHNNQKFFSIFIFAEFFRYGFLLSEELDPAEELFRDSDTQFFRILFIPRQFFIVRNGPEKFRK